jgi:HlyD family secretion protein
MEFQYSNFDHTLESHLHRNSSRSRLIYITLLIMLVLIVILLPFVKVSLSVQGSGFVRPVSGKTEVKAVTGEKVDRVLVRENQFVSKDSPILQLNTGNIEAKLQYLQFQLKETEEFIYDLKILTHKNVINSNEFTSLVYKQEYLQYLQQTEEFHNKRDKANKEYLRNKQLYENEVIAEKEFDDYRFQYASADNEYNIYRNGQISKWQTDLNRYQQQLSGIRSDIAQLNKEKEYYTVRAPVSGTIEQFVGIFPGSHLQIGQTIAIISPDSALIAEIYVSTKDIGYISKEYPVRILVDAFNYNEWGILRGNISEISSDFILINNTPVFRVRCTMDKTWLTLKNNIRGNLKKGMTVRARFLLAKRSLFQIMYQDIDDWINPAQFVYNENDMGK